MKNLFLLLLPFCFSLFSFGQTPKTISYQGVARNATGQPIPNQNIKIKLSLLDVSTSSTSLYTETHTLTTSGQGLFALQIGAGTVLSGTYANLDWSNGPKFVKTEIDPTGGDNFTLSSTNPLNAVPFALFAASGTPGPQGPQGLKGDTGATGPQGPIGLTGPQGLKGDSGARGPVGLTGATGPQGNGFSNGTAAGQMMYWNGTSWVTVAPGVSLPGNQAQTLSFCNGVPTWGPCPAILASVTTSVASNITGIAASSGGNITNDGGAAITARGVCWSNSQNPTIALSTKTVNGNGAGVFTSNLNGLSPSTTYYVRAYATNSVGTTYGNQVSFSTNSVILPTLTTSSISAITSNSANSGGNISSDGGSSVTARGICWSTNPNPTISLSTKTSDGIGLGTFTSNLVGLTINTTYYMRAYATNSAGTAYGNEQSFTTLNLLVDADGNTYNSVKIGSQVWMKQNLQVSKYRNGNPIPTNDWITTSGAYAIYDNVPTNNSIYGKLYNWYAVTDSRGLCPTGWHVPSDAEWKILETFLGMPASELDNSGTGVRGSAQNVGGKLKSVSSLWTSPNTGATDETGFSGLPGGTQNDSSGYGGINNNGFWWSSTQGFPAGNAWSRYLNSYDGAIERSDDDKRFGFSVRCIMD